MQTLILSCNTGAGHNSCAQAVQEAYHSRGEICNITDSLQFISEKAFSACCFCFLSGCNRNEITIPSIVDSMI